MPRTYNNLWDTICAFDNLYEAYLKAREGHRQNGEVIIFSRRLIDNLCYLQHKLRNQTWMPSTPKVFTIYEPKQRTIEATRFSDRVVHHAVMRVIDPLFRKKYISHTYACLPGRGFHYAAAQAQKYMRRREKTYVLKCDISSYFPTVDHASAKRIVRRTIRDPKALWFLDTMLDSHGDIGMGIGALTSQSFAGYLLNTLDHYIKDDLGIKRYVRYMDDFLIFSSSKSELWDLKDQVSEFLGETLQQRLNPKSGVFPVSQGVDFCGYRIYAHYLLPRKRNIKRARKRFYKLARLYEQGAVTLDDIRASVEAFRGYVKHCRAWRTTDSAYEYGKIVRAPMKKGV